MFEDGDIVLVTTDRYGKDYEGKYGVVICTCTGQIKIDFVPFNGKLLDSRCFLTEYVKNISRG